MGGEDAQEALQIQCQQVDPSAPEPVGDGRADPGREDQRGPLASERDRRAEPGLVDGPVIQEEEDFPTRAADDQVEPAVAGPVDQGRAGVAEPGGGRVIELRPYGTS